MFQGTDAKIGKDHYMESHVPNDSEAGSTTRFLSEKEVEVVTSGAIKIRSLQSWRQRGGGPPYYKFGRKVVYREDELFAWINAQRRKSTSDRSQAAA